MNQRSPACWWRTAFLRLRPSREALEAVVTTSSNALAVLSTDSTQVVRTTPAAPPQAVFGSTTGRLRDLEAASFSERALVGWVVEENGPKGIELMLLPVDGQTRGVVGASLDGKFAPASASSNGKTG